MAISILGLLALFLIALFCGFVAQKMVGYSTGGLLASTGFGFVGGLVGSLMAGALGAPALLPIQIGSVTFPLVWALLGAVLVVALVAAVQRRRVAVI